MRTTSPSSACGPTRTASRIPKGPSLPRAQHRAGDPADRARLSGRLQAAQQPRLETVQRSDSSPIRACASRTLRAAHRSSGRRRWRVRAGSKRGWRPARHRAAKPDQALALFLGPVRGVRDVPRAPRQASRAAASDRAGPRCARRACCHVPAARTAAAARPRRAMPPAAAARGGCAAFASRAAAAASVSRRTCAPPQGLAHARACRRGCAGCQAGPGLGLAGGSRRKGGARSGSTRSSIACIARSGVEKSCGAFMPRVPVRDAAARQDRAAQVARNRERR